MDAPHPDLSTPAGRLAHLRQRQAERAAGVPYTIRPVPGYAAWVVRQIQQERAAAHQANDQIANVKEAVSC